MRLHAGPHIDTPHHFVRHAPGIEKLPLETTPADQAERAQNAQGVRSMTTASPTIEPGGML